MAFVLEEQFDDIRPPTELDISRIPEFPASAALHSIEGQNIRGAAMDVLHAYAAQSQMADERNQNFYALQRETG